MQGRWKKDFQYMLNVGHKKWIYLRRYPRGGKTINSEGAVIYWTRPQRGGIRMWRNFKSLLCPPARQPASPPTRQPAAPTENVFKDFSANVCVCVRFRLFMKLRVEVWKSLEREWRGSFLAGWKKGKNAPDGDLSSQLFGTWINI